MASREVHLNRNRHEWDNPSAASEDAGSGSPRKRGCRGGFRNRRFQETGSSPVSRGPSTIGRRCRFGMVCRRSPEQRHPRGPSRRPDGSLVTWEPPVAQGAPRSSTPDRVSVRAAAPRRRRVTHSWRRIRQQQGVGGSLGFWSPQWRLRRCTAACGPAARQQFRQAVPDFDSKGRLWL